MGYNSAIYKKIYDEYTTKYLVARENADKKKAELHRVIPELISVDRELSCVGLEIFSAAISNGSDYKSRLDEVRHKNEELQKKRAELLKKHGYPEDYSDVKYECEICSDTGFVENKMCSCMKRELIMAGFENSGIATLIKEQNFSTFSLDYYKKNQNHYNIMKHNSEFLFDYAESFDDKASPSVLLMGGTGLGKTHLSSAVAKRVIERGYDVFYTGAVDLFSQFEYQRFKSYYQDENETVQRYFDCDLLIIDDLGTELINQFSVSTLYNLINSRISRKKPVIVSTNLSKNDIMQKYTDRITSRMFGEYIILPFVGEDIRKQKIMQ